MYNLTWKKYLPVIRILLKKSAVAEQCMTLNRTDFERSSKIRKPVCAFEIELISGRLDRLNPQAQVKSLLEVLHEDDATRLLLRKHHYGISLSSDFRLCIRNHHAPAQEPVPADTGNVAE